MNHSHNERKNFIAIFLHPEQSGYNASLPLALGLKERGHRVVLIGYHKYEDFVRKHGFEYIKLLDQETYEGLVKQPGPRSIWKMNGHMKEKVDQWLETETPDLALVDQFAWEQAGPFLRRNIPILPVNTCLAGFYNPAVPPVFSPLQPNGDNQQPNRFKNALAWGKIRLFHNILAKINKKTMAPFVEDIENNGAELGWGEYGSRLCLPELVLCPRELDFPITAQTFSQRTYAGACVHTATNDKPFDWNGIDPTQKIVYCSVGSHPRFAVHRRKLFMSAIEALKDRKDVHLILQTANAGDLEALGTLPANVSVHEWVPQIEVLSRASLFITHGGLSSVREAVFHGVPMLVFPWGVDQPGNAARVAYHNLGRVGTAAKITPAAMKAMIDDTLENESVRAAVDNMKTVFESQRDCAAGIEAVEQMLS